MRDDEQTTGLDELDRRLDAALRSYGDPGETTEPRVAAARILAQARVAPRSRRAPWIWAVAAPVSLLLLAAAIVWLLRAPRTPKIAWAPQPPRVAVVPAHPVKAAASAPQMPAPMHAHRSFARRDQVAATAAPPKLPVFPTPRPLSAQEQALVAFAQHGPPAVQRAVLEDQKHWDDPIIVAGLSRQPPVPDSQQDQ